MEETTAIEAFAALANPTRLRAFRALVVAGPDGVAAGELAAGAGVPASTLSGHLARLEQAGLIGSRRASRHIFYALEPTAIRDLIAYLADDCCDGRPELCGAVVRAR